MKDKLKLISSRFSQQLSQVTSLADLDKLKLTYLGRKGEVNQLFKAMSRLDLADKRRIGPEVNRLKAKIEKALIAKARDLHSQTQTNLADAPLTAYLPASFGRLHPIEWLRQKTLNIFHRLGFIEFVGPHIENDWFNFAGLNIPPGHPARDLWDTLYLNLNDVKQEPLLLRTHTSNVQLRALKECGVPLRVMAFDRCFRREILDPRHSHTFSQFEVLVVDKGINMNHLKWLSDYFLKQILGDVTESRFRPKYYPFVEPGVGVDAKCVFCQGKGCQICSNSGWFEIAGAGMVHPQVLKNAGVDPDVYSGFAWGFGPDRMLMLKTGINDIRDLYQGDLWFLRG